MCFIELDECVSSKTSKAEYFYIKHIVIVVIVQLRFNGTRIVIQLATDRRLLFVEVESSSTTLITTIADTTTVNGNTDCQHSRRFFHRFFATLNAK